MNHKENHGKVGEVLYTGGEDEEVNNNNNNKHKRIDGCMSLTYNDKELFDLLKEDKDRYYAVIDNDIIWVIDKKLLEEAVFDITIGRFDNYGEEHIMSMFEYMEMNAEYC